MGSQSAAPLGGDPDASTFPCPFCATPLPPNAERCHLCDWVNNPPQLEAATDTWAVALMSLVPGLGHLYRGHLLTGSLVLVVISPFVLLIAAVLAPATVGLSLLLIPLYLAWVMIHATQVKPQKFEQPLP